MHWPSFCTSHSATFLLLFFVVPVYAAAQSDSEPMVDAPHLSVHHTTAIEDSTTDAEHNPESKAAHSQDKVRDRSDYGRTAIFVELLGSGGLYSVNVDRHLSGPWHLRAGYSQFDVGDFLGGLLRTVPLQVMYTAGDAPSGLELGAGVTFAWAANEFLFSQSAEPSFGAAASFTIGYRYQPEGSGFLHRIGFTPFVGYNDRVHVAPSLGISFGYAF